MGMQTCILMPLSLSALLSWGTISTYFLPFPLNSLGDNSIPQKEASNYFQRLYGILLQGHIDDTLVIGYQWALTLF